MADIASSPEWTIGSAGVAATLDALSGGHFILGLGSSGPQVIEGRHGVSKRPAV